MFVFFKGFIVSGYLVYMGVYLVGDVVISGCLVRLGLIHWSFPPGEIPSLKICLNCQWFVMAFMIISLHVVIIIKLMFKVDALLFFNT